MSADMIVGLRISIIGLGVTFLALGILSLLMRYLPVLFPVAKPDTPVSMEAVDTQQDHLEEMVVALAIGICLLEEQHALDYQDPTLGNLLETK